MEQPTPEELLAVLKEHSGEDIMRAVYFLVFPALLGTLREYSGDDFGQRCQELYQQVDPNKVDERIPEEVRQLWAVVARKLLRAISLS